MIGRTGLVLVATLMALLSGCRSNTNATNGALAGSALGGLAGAVIGNQSGHTAGGAVIGAAAGALTGWLLGEAEDAREERDAAISHANYVEYRNDKWDRAISTNDVLEMAHSGVGDEVIIKSIRPRGSRFDATPQNIVYLKQQGVSDRVIQALQSQTVAPPPAYYEPAPRVVVVHDGPYYRRHGRRYRRW